MEDGRKIMALKQAKVVCSNCGELNDCKVIYMCERCFNHIMDFDR
jgi:hypothetical protein